MNMSKKKKISPMSALEKAQKHMEMSIGDNFEVISAKDTTTRKDDKSVIAWEKWKDPYGNTLKDEEWPGALSPQGVYSDFTPENIDDDEFPIELGRNMSLMHTPIGIVPLTEETMPSKVFNFWMGYTNFKITRKISAIIDDVDGVETQSVFTRYRFRIGIARLFKDREVINCINERVAAYLNLMENKPCQHPQIKLSGEIFRRKAN